MGVLKTEDTDGTIGNNDGLIANVTTAMGLPVTGTDGVDGMMPGTPINPNILGISSELDLFDQTPGSDFVTNNGTIAALGGVTGVTASNMVLIGQFTTDGIFSFKLNLQLGTPQVGGSEIFVAENPENGELTDSTLIYESTPEEPNGISYIGQRNSMSIFPNPATDFVVIKNNMKQSIGQISVYNTTGSLVLSENTQQSNLTLNVAQLAAGLYTVNTNNDGQIQKLSFIKK
jgi:hypothetical protein